MTDSFKGYIHGTEPVEQQRLALLNRLTNPPFLAFLGDVDGLTVLEIGCGLGILAAEVASRNPTGLTLGSDISERQLKECRAKPIPGLAFFRSDARSIPLVPDSVDSAYCRYLLEHVPHPIQVLREIHRLLKPGGRIFVQENNIRICDFHPDCRAFDRVWRAFIELQADLGGDALIGKKLFALLKAADFQSVEISIQPEIHWHGSPGFASWIDNLIGNIRSAEVALIEGGYCSEAETTSAIEELQALRANPNGSAYFYWNRATGIVGS